MQIRVHFKGTPFFEGIEDGQAVQVPIETTLERFLDDRNVRREFQPFLVTLVNGEPCDPARALAEGDELTFFLPVSGG